jgi:hypothetical protein
MTPIKERTALTKKLIRTTLGDHDLEDEEDARAGADARDRCHVDRRRRQGRFGAIQPRRSVPSGHSR